MLSHDRIWAAIDALAERYGMTASGPARRSMVPLIGMADARSTELFTDDGLPTGGDGWEDIDFPDLGTSEQVFALEVTGDALAPLYRDGDVLILSPTAPIRKGDRVVVRLRNGEIAAGELKRRLVKSLEIHPLARAGEERTIPMEDVHWTARVMWARQ